ncbi:MAG: hypothetical protein HYS27_19970 [Deltaproteobacteria bacterium]|nr:hypothetical protein [Deltaproteobacteria bacterium]
MKSPRGYLLFEAAMGGAIIAIVIGGLLSEITRSRALNVAGSRDVESSQLVLERMEAMRNSAASSVANFNALAAGTPADAGVPAGYTRTTTVSGILTEATPLPNNGAFTLNYKDVTVTVTYNIKLSQVETRQSQATVRVYQLPP